MTEAIFVEIGLCLSTLFRFDVGPEQFTNVHLCGVSHSTSITVFFFMLHCEIVKPNIKLEA